MEKWPRRSLCLLMGTRLEWVQERVSWNLIIWSDESTFNLFGSGERVYVRRRVGEEYLSQCIQQRVKFSRGMG